MTDKPYSLKRQLLISISIPVLAAGFLIAVLSFLFSWHEITEVYDAQMAHTARVLIDLTEDDIHNSDYPVKHALNDNSDIQHRYERKTGYRLWYKDKLVLESLRAKDFGDFRAPEDFSDQKINGKPWRFFVYKDPNKDITVEISERYAIRFELINQLMLSLLIPALLFIPVILVLIWFATNRSLKPLIRLSADVDKRSSDDLTPVEINNVPLETLPLAQAMNRLFQRIHTSFIREREFTDYAAHELRTPLAAMKTQTQVLLKKASTNPELQEGFVNLGATIDRSTRLIEQLLSLSRLQNENLPSTRIDFCECIRDVTEEMKHYARAKQQTLNLKIPEAFYIHGHYDSIVIMLRNFIDNAIKYTPTGGAIDISLTTNGKFKISDTGPGMNAEQKNKAFDRFTRFDKSGQAGSGLGLAIAEWIATNHNVQIQLEDNQEQGLSVSIQWPLLTDQAPAF